MCAEQDIAPLFLYDHVQHPELRQPRRAEKPLVQLWMWVQGAAFYFDRSVLFENLCHGFESGLDFLLIGVQPQVEV